MYRANFKLEVRVFDKRERARFTYKGVKNFLENGIYSQDYVISFDPDRLVEVKEIVDPEDKDLVELFGTYPMIISAKSYQEAKIGLNDLSQDIERLGKLGQYCPIDCIIRF